MPRVYFSLGSNVDPEKNLKLGVDELRQRYGKLHLSPVYRNKAVGFHGDDFLNLVVSCNARDYIESIQAAIEDIHALAGRQRREKKFSSRSLDIDLLTYGDVVTDVPPVTLPRSDILKYAFVLKPLADIAPNDVHPETGRSYAEHWADMRTMRIEKSLREVDIDL
ncbi:MAG: 2-amino-4-hydroxy-6-hydroxymethyldihydropteridine diphosphokinase [Pseudomonadota bacterium]